MGNLPKELKDLADRIGKDQKSWFGSMFEAVWGGFQKMFPNLMAAAWNFWLTHGGKIEDGMWDGMLSMYEDSGMISKEVKDSLYEMRNIMTPFDLLLFAGLNITLSAGYLAAQMAPAQALMMQAINKDQRPGLPQYRDVLQAAFIAPEKTGAVREIMKREGFTDDDIELLFLANYRLYDVEMTRVLFLREIISSDEMFVRMREQGFTDTRIKEIIQTWEVLPTPQDLLFMVGKEAFEPDIIELIGLDDEFPEDQLEFMAQQGISSFWAHKYWYAHWDQPSVQAGFEMLHRDVINWEELEVLFKAVEMPPYWRDKLTKIAFSPFTRVDVRRMHDMGVLTPEQVKRAYKDLGFDDEKAEKMTDFTIRYNQQNNKELTKSQLIKSYISGLISRADCKDMLISLDYNDDLAEYVIILAEFERDLDYQDAIVKNLGERYTNNLITKADLINRMGRLNLPDTQVQILIDKWDIELYTDMKVPSKTDMEKFYLNDLTDRDEYYRGLRQLSYTAVDADRYIAISDLKK